MSRNELLIKRYTMFDSGGGHLWRVDRVDAASLVFVLGWINFVDYNVVD